MNSKRIFLSCLVSAMCWAACGGTGDGNGGDGGDGGPLACDPESQPCPEGERCNQDRECVPADPLEISTDDLPDGRVGFGYSQLLEATGGLKPYYWEIEEIADSLSFLTISSGGLLEGTLEEEIVDAPITVSVTDAGYSGGVTVQKQFFVSFVSCQEGDREICYIADGGVCYEGFRTCTAGHMGECVAGDNTSSDRRHCGTACGECSGSIADGCVEGRCSCGELTACEGGYNCCDGECIDVTSNIENCGACQNDCNTRLVHVSSAEIMCNDGQCDYSGDCDHGWLDCDDRRENGCEKQVMVSACGDCDIDCTTLVTHVPGDSKLCAGEGSYFICDYSGECINDFGDCDGDRSNGCEQYLLDDSHCGTCENDCAGSDSGTLCVTPNDAEPYQHECGCRYDSASGTHEGCTSGWICCQHVCRDPASDALHCGVCDAACGAGSCIDGACECAADEDCPKPSSGTSCLNAESCVCPDSGNGEAACPAGEYCCDGSAGGSGGPDGEADLGCCPETCGWNDSEAPCVW